MIYNIEFRPEVITRPDGLADVGRNVLVGVTPFVDGERIERDGVTSFTFDAATCLALGVTSCKEFYPFTCSCGGPDCVGIHSPARLEVDETEVRWVLPLEPFGTRFREKYAREGEGPLFRFARPQYESALSSLTAKLEAIQRAHGRPANIWLRYGNDERLEQSLTELVAAHRDSLLEWEASSLFRTEVIPDLLGKDLMVSTKDGTVFSIPLENLASAVADEQLGISIFESPDRELRDERRELIATEIAPKLREGLTGVVEAAREVPWNLMRNFLMFIETSPEGEVSAGAEDDEWPDVSFELRVAPASA